jgi:hypothetical protein
MRRAKRQPTIDEVKAIIAANIDKVESFDVLGKNGYLLNKGRYNGLGIIYALDRKEYERFTVYQAASKAKRTTAKTYKAVQ